MEFCAVTMLFTFAFAGENVTLYALNNLFGSCYVRNHNITDNCGFYDVRYDQIYLRFNPNVFAMESCFYHEKCHRAIRKEGLPYSGVRDMEEEEDFCWDYSAHARQDSFFSTS